MNEVLTFLTAWLVDLLVLGTALLAASALLLVILRQPSARMAVARGTLLGLAMLCVLTALPLWPRQPLMEMLSTGAAEQERDAAIEVLADTGTMTVAPLVIDSPPAIDESLLSAPPSAPSLTFTRFLKLLPLFWLGAATCALAYIFVGGWRAFRLLHTAVKAPEWSQQELTRLIAPRNRSPRLKTSERIATAVALVAWRPHILLAAKSVCEENKAAIRAALAHEWAHIRHGDLWLLALERLLLPVFCLHPLFWLLRRQIRIDQELLADAAAAGDAPVEYAQALLTWAKAESNQAAPRLGIAALSLWEHPSNLSRRVEMLLTAPYSISTGGSRVWKWLAPLSLLAMVLGLSLITLRPAAVAQDDAIIDITFVDEEAQPRPEKIKKAKKEKPKKSEASRTAAENPPVPDAANGLILMDILVGQVEHAALENAESSLGDLIQAASEDHCRLEGDLIVADLSAEQFARLTAELKKANALEILSKPRVTTIDGQKASVQIGSQVPLTRQDETIKGDGQRRVDFKNVGELIVICPHQNEKDPLRLILDVAATHTELDKKAELRTGDDTPRFITHQLKLKVEASVGKTLVITEREPKRGSGRTHTILLAIGPQKLAPPLPEPAPPAVTKANKASSYSPNDLDRLRDENAALLKQVDDLRARLIDLEVQIRWLRDAAAPGGKEKVSDDVFLRRVYLDLTGAVPTVDEAKVFLKDQDKQKRDKLIDKLLENKVYRSPGEAEKWKDLIKNSKGAFTSTLSVKSTSASRAEVGSEVQFKIEVTNTGRTPLNNVTMKDNFDPGLTHTAGEVSPIAKTLDTIAPNETKRFAITFRVDQPGKLCHRLDVMADGGHSATTTGCVEAVAASGAAAMPPDSSSPKSEPQPAKDDADIVQVVRLKRVSADEAAKKLTALFQLASEKPTIVAEERTNSLLLRGSPKALRSAIAMLEVLDVEPVPTPAPGTPEPKANENSALDLKQLDRLEAEADLQSAKGQYERELNELVWRKLGVKLAVMNEGDIKQLKSNYHGGLKVLEVHTRGPARQEGIRPGDVLVGLHHWETISLENIAFVLKREEVARGEPVDFYLLRGSETMHGHIRLAKQNAE